jgi:hypothetical protein
MKMIKANKFWKLSLFSIINFKITLGTLAALMTVLCLLLKMQMRQLKLYYYIYIPN